MKVLSCWQLADIYASITVQAPEGSGMLAITASVAPGCNGGWCAEWWTTSMGFADSGRTERLYRTRAAATMRAIHALHDELRDLSRPALARAS